MAILAHTVRPSLCLSCLQRVLSNDYAPFTGLSYIQIRGKKKMPKKRTTINVRLLQDVKGYGPRGKAHPLARNAGTHPTLTGTIVPVSRGLFRNSWLPHRRAEYLSTAQGVNGSKVAAVRDTLFGREEEEEQDRIVTGTNIQSQAAPRVKPTTSVISVRLSNANWEAPLMSLCSLNVQQSSLTSFYLPHYPSSALLSLLKPHPTLMPP